MQPRQGESYSDYLERTKRDQPVSAVEGVLAIAALVIMVCFALWLGWNLR